MSWQQPGERDRRKVVSYYDATPVEMRAAAGCIGLPIFALATAALVVIVVVDFAAGPPNDVKLLIPLAVAAVATMLSAVVMFQYRTPLSNELVADADGLRRDGPAGWRAAWSDIAELHFDMSLRTPCVFVVERSPKLRWNWLWNWRPGTPWASLSAPVQAAKREALAALADDHDVKVKGL